MARQIIDTTTPQPNGKMGDTAKVAFEKINGNFEELYDAVANIPEDTTGDIEALDVRVTANEGAISELFNGKADATHTHSASDITSGTLSDARLPSTMSGKTFNGDVVAAGRVTASEFASPDGTPGPKYFVGDDAALHDVNLPHTIGVAGIDSPAHGYIKFGTAPGVIGWDGSIHIVETSLRVYGDVIANGFPTASSRALKCDIRPLHVDADIIDQFQPVTFRYKAAPEREVSGLILEDVTQIFPLACTGDGIDYGQLVPLLIATIQHDRAQLRDLAARVEALEQTLGQTLHDLPAQPTGDSEA